MTLRLEKIVNEKTFPDCMKCMIKQPKEGRLELKEHSERKGYKHHAMHPKIPAWKFASNNIHSGLR